MTLPDRRALLAAQAAITGLDFVTVSPDQLSLIVRFLVPPPAALEAGLAASEILLTPEPDEAGVVRPQVTGLAWAGPADARTLTLSLDQPGGFGLYRLTLAHPLVDPYFNGLLVDFKVDCTADRDCRRREPPCPEDTRAAPVIDWRARDFDSYRRALLDFAAVAYPAWTDRREADAGVMMAEALAAIGDELAWYQDRICREAYLATATERRSLRHHARFLDYQPDDGEAAFAWMEVTAGAAGALALPAGMPIHAEDDAGTRFTFALGWSIADETAGRTFAVDPAIDVIPAHIWDEDDTCLKAGATRVVVAGHWAARLPLIELADDGTSFRWLLLRTDPPDPARPARRLVVRLLAVEEGTDPLAAHPDHGTAISTLVFDPPTAVDLDLEALTARGNLLPATAGEPREAWFCTGEPEALAGVPQSERELRGIVRTVERQGADGATRHLFTLPGSEDEPLAWRGGLPMLAVDEMRWTGAGWALDAEWTWRPSLIGVASSLPEDRHVTIEDGAWRRIIGFWRGGGEIVHQDYAGPRGATLRFGEGEFGLPPPGGSVFRVRYRLGNGSRGNLPADTIRHLDAAAPAGLAAVNPLPASGGREPETDQSIRVSAPEAFRAERLFAVRPEDHAEIAERLPWVTRAGARTRWTGSWRSVFVTPDPADAVVLAEDRREALIGLMDRVRQAGRHVVVNDPAYADVDLRILVCAKADAFPDEVGRSVEAALLGVHGQGGFFDPDNFTFGTPLDRSRLEAAIQSVPGVKAVEAIDIRRRGLFDWRPLAASGYRVGADTVIRVTDDPLRPRQGSLTVRVEGGA